MSKQFEYDAGQGDEGCVRPRLFFDDLRRSAVRNIMQAGVQQAVAMRSADIPLRIFSNATI